MGWAQMHVVETSYFTFDVKKGEPENISFHGVLSVTTLYGDFFFFLTTFAIIEETHKEDNYFTFDCDKS